ncbi:MAG: hypothetical protein ACE360_10165 [Hyphomicrobiales bacterium]
MKYGKPAWYYENIRFPKGRDPHTDLFSDATIKKIGDFAGTLSEKERNQFQIELREVAFHFMCALYTTPLRLAEGPKDVKLSARVRHLERHIIKPSSILLDALSNDQTPLLSEWPETLNMPAPARKSLLKELRRLHDRSTELAALLADRLPNERLTQEFMTDLGNALSSVVKSFYPGIRVSRGTYFKTEGSDEPTMHGTFLSVMEICIKEILPKDKSLSSKLIGEIRKLQGP